MSRPRKSKGSSALRQEFEDEDFEELLSESDQLPDSSVVMGLSELAANYASCVPFRIQVVNGFMAENQRDPTIGVDEIYSVHLVRETRVILVKQDGKEFKVPVNSNFKFGLIDRNAVPLYRNVDEIINGRSLPSVVAVMNKYLHHDGKLTLHKSEVMIVKDVVKAKGGRNALSVFSLYSQRDLLLPSTCDAGFTTDPKSTKMYLTDMLSHMTDFLPHQAWMYPSEGSSFTSLMSSVVTIDRVETHRSVVVSLFRDNPTARRKRETEFIDIPTTINIQVCVVRTDKSDAIYQDIFKESQHLLTDFNLSRIQACVDADTDDNYMTQAQLLAEIRRERERVDLASMAPPHYQKLLAAKKDAASTYEMTTSPGGQGSKREGVAFASRQTVAHDVDPRSKYVYEDHRQYLASGDPQPNGRRKSLGGHRSKFSSNRKPSANEPEPKQYQDGRKPMASETDPNIKYYDGRRKSLTSEAGHDSKYGGTHTLASEVGPESKYGDSRKSMASERSKYYDMSIASEMDPNIQYYDAAPAPVRKDRRSMESNMSLRNGHVKGIGSSSTYHHQLAAHSDTGSGYYETMEAAPPPTAHRSKV